MSTLQQLGVTLGVGTGVFVITLTLFASAVTLQITHIAPRCEARPREVIYYNNNNTTTAGSSDVLYRGNPFGLGWMRWILGLSYHTLLTGVPGTGTRGRGEEGHLLKLNLDKIVLLRFHALGFRVACFACVMYCCVVLPIYFTARCFDAPFDDQGVVGNCTVDTHYNLTRYERITLANIPPLNEANDIWDSSTTQFRLYMVVLCSWLVCWFTCYELQKEWIDLLAMRRVYYLEYNHWQGRRHELKQTMLYGGDSNEASKHKNHADSIESHYQDCHNPHLHRREAWIPHPEQRDTPPNIELYSVLVSGLPKRPLEAVSEQDLELALQEGMAASKLDWQLSVTSAFFDYCVPNQPGFSSSVAAVSILPGARELKTAWKTWIRATKKLQRLRYIRRQLLERGVLKQQHEYETIIRSSHNSNNNHHHTNGNVNHDNHQTFVQSQTDGKSGMLQEEDEERGMLLSSTGHAPHDHDFDIYLRTSSRRDSYIKDILGYITDQDVEEIFLQQLEMGPEQTAVYSKELAKGSGGCCPYGCCDQQIRCSSTQKLLEMEVEAEQAARDAFADLEIARKKAAIGEDTNNENPNRQAPSSSLEYLDATPSKPPKSKSDPTLDYTRLYDAGQATLKEAPDHGQRRGSKYVRGYSDTEALNNSKHDQKQSAATMGNVSISGSGATSNKNGTLTVKTNLPCHATNSSPNSHFSSLLKLKSSMVRATTDETHESMVNNVSLRNSSLGSTQWEHVRQVAMECEQSARRKRGFYWPHTVSNGEWNPPSLATSWRDFWRQVCECLSWTVSSSREATDVLSRDSGFAVVTFTSRQAAIAARKCLADGRGSDRWITIDELPTPPLADASPFDICDCRGCCRPVTVALSRHQKAARSFFTKALLAVVYMFYTVPITFVSTFGSEQAGQLLPHARLDQQALYGFFQAQLLTLFLSIAPTMFLSIANFGSNATSMIGAEFAATKYFWWFYLLFALVGSSVTQMALQAFEDGTFQFFDTLQRVAATIPVQVSSTWANWIILRATVFHPLFYLLQLNTFLYACFGLKCCVRCSRGGGSGARVPYRLYVESGMVMLCVLALAPAAPLISTFAVLYFFICNPVLRWVLIFVYKNEFDGGGIRWIFLSEMVMSCLIVSSVLLGAMLLLKNAIGAAILAFILIIPTLVFRRTLMNRFRSAYEDAALLQTSLLDGWDTFAEDADTRTLHGREEFRRFLVDAHKAAYVPVCLSGRNTDKVLTAEPAVVVPTPTDTDFGDVSQADIPSPLILNDSTRSFSGSRVETPVGSFNLQQAGAVMRRNFAISGHVPGSRDLSYRASLSPTESHEVPINGPNSFKKSGTSENGHAPNIKISSLGMVREEDGELLVSSFDTEKQKDK